MPTKAAAVPSTVAAVFATPRPHLTRLPHGCSLNVKATTLPEMHVAVPTTTVATPYAVTAAFATPRPHLTRSSPSLANLRRGKVVAKSLCRDPHPLDLPQRRAWWSLVGPGGVGPRPTSGTARWRKRTVTFTQTGKLRQLRSWNLDGALGILVKQLKFSEFSRHDRALDGHDRIRHSRGHV